MLCLVAQWCLTLCSPVDCSLLDSSVHGDCPGKNTGAGFHALFQGNLPNPGIELRSPTLRADSLPTEPQGKPKNAGVGNLYLLQWIFPTQELNQGLLRCRRILYQLNYQGSPGDMLIDKYFLYTKQGHNKYWLSLLLPGFLHKLIFFPPSLCMFCFSGIQLEMGKGGGTYMGEI